LIELNLLVSSLSIPPSSKGQVKTFSCLKLRKIIKYVISFCIFILIIGSVVKTAKAQNSRMAYDQDGNNYKTIIIGSQTWMAENLRTTKYNDGTPIPLVTAKSAWIILSTPAYCWYNNDTTYKNSYGALYNGYAVNTNKLCPEDWHISTDAEWTTLIQLLGGENVAGGKLKELGTHWMEPNSGATNEIGFTALPGGTRYTNGLFFTIKTIGYWWTFTGSNVLNGWYWSMSSKNGAVSRSYDNSTNGFSVRCVKD
jgi:uncharacterized protein (TIGR02145 family)